MRSPLPGNSTKPQKVTFSAIRKLPSPQLKSNQDLKNEYIVC